MVVPSNPSTNAVNAVGAGGVVAGGGAGGGTGGGGDELLLPPQAERSTAAALASMAIRVFVFITYEVLDRL